MSILEFWTKLDPAGKKRYAKKAGFAVNVMSQIAHGHLGISPARAAKMAAASNGELVKENVLIEVAFRKTPKPLRKRA